MSQESEPVPTLPPAARWAAVAVLGAAGIAGVVRAWMVWPAAAPHAVATDTLTDAATPPGESVATALPRGEAAAAPAGSSGVSRTINLNTATAAELDLLPGIGPALAARIIEDREANGPYRTLDDLDRVSGIGPKTIAKLAPYASVE